MIKIVKFNLLTGLYINYTKGEYTELTYISNYPHFLFLLFKVILLAFLTYLVSLFHYHDNSPCYTDIPYNQIQLSSLCSHIHFMYLSYFFPLFCVHYYSEFPFFTILPLLMVITFLILQTFYTFHFIIFCIFYYHYFPYFTLIPKPILLGIHFLFSSSILTYSPILPIFYDFHNFLISLQFSYFHYVPYFPFFPYLYCIIYISYLPPVF